MICGHCGDELTKMPVLETTKIIALISALAFMTPLVLMVFSIVQEQSPAQPNEVIGLKVKKIDL